MGFKIIETATHLFHILALIGCGHLLSNGEMNKAIECAVVGSLCVVMLASADAFVSWARGK